MNDKNIHIFNRFYIALILLWQPLQMAFLHFDAGGRITFLFTIIAFLINIINDEFRQIAFSKPALVWLIWIIYAFINMIAKDASIGVPLSSYFVNLLFSPYLMMTITCYEGCRNRLSLIKLLFWCLIAYAVIGFFFMDVSRFSTSYETVNSLGNKLPITSVFIAYFVGLLWIDKKYRKWFLISCILFILIIITVCATRKALGAVIIIMLFVVLSQVDVSFKTVGTLALVGLLLYYGYGYIMDHTIMGERFQEGLEMGAELNTTDMFWLSFLGDRVYFYLEGWNLFVQHPLTGIGLHNFRDFTGAGNRLHTEYIVQLAENGIVGTIIFISFYMGVIKKIIRIKSVNHTASFVSLGCIISILFLGITTWLFEGEVYFMCIGVTLSYYFENKFQLNENV